jgi:signal transduction histidine kinase
VHRLLEMAPGGELTETVLAARGAQIGKLLLVWPATGSDPRRPVVHSDSLHRKTLAVLVANSIFEAAHNGLGSLLNRLQDWLGLRGVDTREEWREMIHRAATDAGLLWAAALVENQVVGPDEALATLGALPKPSSKPGEEELVQLLPPPSSATGAGRLLALRLRRSQATLWLAVGRTEFGREIERGWPWRGFLERLAETADLALARIVAIESVQRLQKEADHLKGLVTPGTDPAIFLHDIRNLARNFQFAAQSLDDARKLKLLTAPANVTRHISALHESAQRLYDMTDAIMKSKPADARKAYPLVDPIQGLQQLLKPVLEQHHTRLEVEVSGDIVVVFPFHLAHQALLSLVSNSIDATEAKGTITIKAENYGAWVLCHVIDNGPGVDPDLGDPFELGKSTKGTGGKGLFLVQRLLRDHGGDAQLTTSSPGYTVFTLKFPKKALYEKKESPDHRG